MKIFCGKKVHQEQWSEQ